MKFQKKPVVIEAVQWDGVNVQALAEWAAQADLASKKARGVDIVVVNGQVSLPIDVVVLERGYRVEVNTLEGVMVAEPGDYIICGVKGEFYPCKPDIFAATYKPAPDAGTYRIEHKTGMVSHAFNPGILRRARDFYAVYCASSDGKNYQGLPCPAWEALTPAVRGHWYTVALRSLQLEAVADPAGVAAGVTSLGNEPANAPNDYVLGHLGDPAHALDVWCEYSGQA